MKRFISLAMASVMAASLLPATAFAATGDVKATAKVVGGENYTEDEMKGTDGKIDVNDAPELQLTFTTADYSSSSVPDAEIEMTLDNAEFLDESGNVIDEDSTILENLDELIYLKDDDNIQYSLVWDDTDSVAYFQTKSGDKLTNAAGTDVYITDLDISDTDNLTFTLVGQMERGYVLSYNLTSQLTKTSKNTQATVTVDSSDIVITNGDDLVYASIESKGIDASVKKLKDVAVEEIVTIEDLKIEPSVGANMAAVVDDGDTIKLKLNSGFEFANSTSNEITIEADGTEINPVVSYDDDEIIITVDSNISGEVDELTIIGIQVEATSAKEGSTATIKVSASGNDSVSVEVATVVDYAVSMSVDEDEDVPVIYSGVDVDNTGITDDSDHESLEVTIEETFAGAWDNAKKFTLSLPEGVYAADVDVVADGIELDREDFIKAYDNGEYEYFEFDKRIFEENDSDNDPYELDVTFTLAADPGFEGDVVLSLSGDALDEDQEVVIAKFVKPYTVSAQQNDLNIDYRNTEIPTDVVITEAEAGLWEKGSEFALTLDKIEFDDDASVTPDDESGLSVKNVKTTDGEIRFTIDEESDDEPATVTVSDLTLYMDRSLPAGAYDLNAYALTMLGVDSAEEAEDFDGSDYTTSDKGYLPQTLLADTTVFVGDEDDDINYVVKAGFVNIVTAGSDTTGFTTKLTVPIGENYLIAGETQVTLDAPAYINAEGYTMLPVRAISTSLGIDNNNVLWDQATRTVTILYGDRIISMTAGSSVMYVNGSSIPTSSSVEIVNDRTFLPMRDLATALGVTDLTWDTDPTTGKTTTVYMNANR